MGELVLKKAIACRSRLVSLRAAIPVVPEDVLKDERLEAFLSFTLFLLVQDLIDLAAHIVSARGLAVPGSHRETFDALAKAGVITQATAQEMGAMAALRNRVAHAYGDLDPVRMVREMPTGLASAQRFLDQLASAIDEAT